MPKKPKTPVPAPGGAKTALDMTDERDRGLMREAAKRWKKRWRGITDERMERWAEDLEIASEQARSARPLALTLDDRLKLAGTFASIVRTAAVLEAQNQSDEHHADKTARDDKALALDAARTLAALPEADKIAIIHQAGLGHMLPPAPTETE